MQDLMLQSLINFLVLKLLIFCTEIASKLVEPTQISMIGDLCKELLNVDLNKSQQSSDWSAKLF